MGCSGPVRPHVARSLLTATQQFTATTQSPSLRPPSPQCALTLTANPTCPRRSRKKSARGEENLRALPRDRRWRDANAYTHTAAGAGIRDWCKFAAAHMLTITFHRLAIRKRKITMVFSSPCGAHIVYSPRTLTRTRPPEHSASMGSLQLHACCHYCVCSGSADRLCSSQLVPLSKSYVRAGLWSSV